MHVALKHVFYRYSLKGRIKLRIGYFKAVPAKIMKRIIRPASILN